MRVVVDFDAPRRVFEAESFGGRFQKFALGTVLRLPARQLFARILQRHVEDLPLLAALGQRHFHFAFGAQ